MNVWLTAVSWRSRRGVKARGSGVRARPSAAHAGPDPAPTYAWADWQTPTDQPCRPAGPPTPWTPPRSTETSPHTHKRLTTLCPGLPRWAGTRKVNTIRILLKQKTVSDSGISWAICKSAPRSRQITTPAPHHSVFLQAGCYSCRPTKSVKALKVKHHHLQR